jgi:hypothetical protein
MQRLLERLDRESSERGGGGPTGHGSLEARVAKVEAHCDHMQRDITEIKTDLKTLLWAGIAGFAVTWGGIIGLGLLIARATGMLK